MSAKLLILKDKKHRVLQSEMRKVKSSYEEVMEMGMTEAQREVFLVIDEWWKKFGYGPSLRDIAHLRGKSGLGSTKMIIDRLVNLGALKRLEGMGRSVRPVYLNFRDLE